MGGIKPQDERTLRSACGGELKAIGVVKLYLSKPDPNSWSDSGIMGGIALVAAQGTHYVRIVDFSSCEVVFEQEWYPNFQYTAASSFFHTLELSDCVGGFCFSDPSDAGNFAASVGSLPSHAAAASPPPRPSNPTPPAHSPAPTPSVTVTSTPSNFSSSSPQRASSGSNIASAPAKKKTEKVGFFGRIKNKIKGDSGPDPSNFVLSGPTGFRHDSHIGWDPEVCFFIFIFIFIF